MSDPKKRKRPLVADKRYSAVGAKPASAKATRKPVRRKTPTKPRRPARKGVLGFLIRSFRFVVTLLWRIIWRSATVGALVLAMAVTYVYATLPALETLLDGRARGSVTMLDRNGATFAWRGDQFGGAVRAKTVSPFLKFAFIATEDKRFYRHFGLSPRGIASAVRINMT